MNGDVEREREDRDTPRDDDDRCECERCACGHDKALCRPEICRHPFARAAMWGDGV